ncbi:uncharacterized protein PGTG_12508 [Puccinia graminis f. sp. tritici CRL 75-36-700-3]|uniref:Uncharacterized protein n=1 Tax=Puccinia graminis f. sp. tritici (strain CRL 75-36-700-3 / race SCCL) TaxID=418459 RepID=E3KUW1_PUCGT|nr:uncharacterized protein PGTG_12508 [Puccinia graminis f. sp. tritici CRL 75-36-700-3]EFP88061.1 hypothetical protein PGTG_12508 [Puccinia graminis f. sp. tritici CRL 75-36-700-3]
MAMSACQRPLRSPTSSPAGAGWATYNSETFFAKLGKSCVRVDARSKGMHTVVTSRWNTFGRCQSLLRWLDDSEARKACKDGLQTDPLGQKLRTTIIELERDKSKAIIILKMAKRVNPTAHESITPT